MGPTIESLNKGKLDSHRLVGMCTNKPAWACPSCISWDGQTAHTGWKLPLTSLIMYEHNYKNHRSNPSDVLAKSRQMYWINNRKLSKQLMADIPEH